MEEAIKGNWSVRQLERQIATCSYSRVIANNSEVEKVDNVNEKTAKIKSKIEKLKSDVEEWLQTKMKEAQDIFVNLIMKIFSLFKKE